MVQRLLDFKSFADSTLPTAFADEVDIPSVGTSAQAVTPSKQPNKDFSYALIDAFQTGFKVRRNKPAEMIAKYLDKAMRKGQRDVSDADFEAQLDSALGLYRFTNDKDVFRTFYHRALAKRLLLERSASDDFEKAMLKKLKERAFPQHSASSANKPCIQSMILNSAWVIICSMTSHYLGTQWRNSYPRRRPIIPHVFQSWSSNRASGLSPREGKKQIYLFQYVINSTLRVV